MTSLMLAETREAPVLVEAALREDVRWIARWARRCGRIPAAAAAADPLLDSMFVVLAFGFAEALARLPGLDADRPRNRGR